MGLTLEDTAWDEVKFLADHYHDVKALPKNQKCKYCEEPASKRVIWAEGRAYIPVCAGHESKAREQIKKNNDEVTEVRAIKATVITPGGRVGNNRRTGSRSNRENWVEQTSAGELPEYIRTIRNGLMREGHSESRATALAVAAVERWRRGGGNVSPKVRAAAAAAYAQWEKMKAEKTAHERIEEIKATRKKKPEDTREYSPDEQLQRGEEELRRQRRSSGSSSGGGSSKFREEDHPRAGDGKFTSGEGKEDDEDSREDRRKNRDKYRKQLLEEAPHKPGSKGQHVRLLQDLLEGEGFGTFKLDGVYGPKTVAAVKKAQKKMGLKEDGVASKAFVQRLLNATGEQVGSRSNASTKTEEGADGNLSPDTGAKDETMDLEYKNVGVNGFKVDDPDQGIVTTIVSVTGLKDNVNDNILPGAYLKTLSARRPKGVWSHDWDTPVSKTLEAKELMPGDPDLPKTLRNGQAWPAEAGGLLIKTQFNLETQRGREAYSDVKFFGDEQEWSIGYNVPTGGAKMDTKTGIREISTLDLYEYSPVLFGAMPNAVTRSVKSAQNAFKVLVKSGAASSWLAEAKDGEETPDPQEVEVVEDAETEEPETTTDQDDDEDDADEITTKIGRVLSSGNMKLVEEVVAALTKLLNSARPEGDGPTEEKDAVDAVEYKSMAEVVAAKTQGTDAGLLESAREFDRAMESKDQDAMDEAGDAILDALEAQMVDATPEAAESIKTIATVLDTFLDAAEGDEGDGGSGGNKSDEQEVETKEPSIVIDLKALELDYAQ
jgi:peptidoglycan hydrolase-like protein with peptidoglycan-binding domain